MASACYDACKGRQPACRRRKVKERVNMNKTDLTMLVAEKTGLTKKQAAEAVATMLDGIKDALVKEEKVQLLGFGTFETKARAAHNGRNPATGEAIKIAASKSAAFKPGKSLKAALNVPAKKSKAKAKTKKK